MKENPARKIKKLKGEVKRVRHRPVRALGRVCDCTRWLQMSVSPLGGSKSLGATQKRSGLGKQEIVAELSAAALCCIVGKTSTYPGNSYRYISRYAEEANLTPIQGCLRVIKDVYSEVYAGRVS